MEFDLASYTLGIVATVIGSSTVAFFALWIQTRSTEKRAKKSLFSEIKHNYEIVRELVDLSTHWAFLPMPFQTASFDYAKRSGFLYNLKTETYERISRAYDIMNLIEKKDYHPDGTASNTFSTLKDLLKEIIEKDLK